MELCIDQHFFTRYGMVDSSLEEHQNPFSLLLSNLKDAFTRKKNDFISAPNEEVSFANDLEVSLQDSPNILDKNAHLVLANLSDFVEDGMRRYGLMNRGKSLDRAAFQFAIENVSRFQQIQNPYVVFSDDSMNVIFYRNSKKCSFQYYTDEPEMVAVSVREKDQIRIKDFDNDELLGIWNYCK